MPRVITEQWNFPIKPRDIDAKGLLGPQGFAIEKDKKTAACIVLLCQEKGIWIPFSSEQLEETARKEEITLDFSSGFDHRLFAASRCCGADVFVVPGEDEKFRVTDSFVLLCYEIAPVIKTRIPDLPA